jgi:hypothetical protein
VSKEYKCTTGDGSVVEVRKMIDAVEVIALSGSSIASACLTPTDARALAADRRAEDRGGVERKAALWDAFMRSCYVCVDDENAALVIWPGGSVEDDAEHTEWGLTVQQRRWLRDNPTLPKDEHAGAAQRMIEGAELWRLVQAAPQDGTPERRVLDLLSDASNTPTPEASRGAR